MAEIRFYSRTGKSTIVAERLLEYFEKSNNRWCNGKARTILEKIKAANPPLSQPFIIKWDTKE
jgi:hypothetical protein